MGSFYLVRKLPKGELLKGGRGVSMQVVVEEQSLPQQTVLVVQSPFTSVKEYGLQEHWDVQSFEQKACASS